MDECLVAAADQTRSVDEEKTKFIEEDLLYPLRQRIQDFQQQLVNQQGIIVMEIIRKNSFRPLRRCCLGKRFCLL